MEPLELDPYSPIAAPRNVVVFGGGCLPCSGVSDDVLFDLVLDAILLFQGLSQRLPTHIIVGNGRTQLRFERAIRAQMPGKILPPLTTQVHDTLIGGQWVLAEAPQ